MGLDTIKDPIINLEQILSVFTSVRISESSPRCLFVCLFVFWLSDVSIVSLIKAENKRNRKGFIRL